MYFTKENKSSSWSNMAALFQPQSNKAPLFIYSYIYKDIYIYIYIVFIYTFRQ